MLGLGLGRRQMSATVIFGEEGRGYLGGKCSGVKYPAFTSGDLSRCTRDPAAAGGNNQQDADV